MFCSAPQFGGGEYTSPQRKAINYAANMSEGKVDKCIRSDTAVKVEMCGGTKRFWQFRDISVSFNTTDRPVKAARAALNAKLTFLGPCLRPR